MVNCNGRNILRAYNFPVAKDGHFSDQNVRLAARLQFFDQTIAPVTPLGAAHRTIFRRLLHMMIGTRDFVGAPHDDWDAGFCGLEAPMA